MYNLGTEDLVILPENEMPSRHSLATDNSGSANSTVYHFRFKPQNGILNSLKPLLPKQEFTLSFDRSAGDLALISKKRPEDDDPVKGQVLTLRNPYLTAEYISSPYLRNHFDGINSNPISYFYDEISVYHKSLPLNDTIIRFPNLIGGNTPTYIFAGVIPTSALGGSITECGTLFKRNNVKEFDITLNGYSCPGLPLTNLDKTPIDVYDTFLKVTKRKFKNECPAQIVPSDFCNFHFIFSHKFEGEPTESGWVGINLKLEKAYEQNHTLVVWTSYDVELKIDQYNRVEKLVL